jgi:hypothetical protein
MDSPRPVPCPGRLGGEGRLEDARQVALFNAGAGVTDAEEAALALQARLDGQQPALGLHRVQAFLQEVEQHLRQLRRVPEELRQVRRQVHLQLHLRVGRELRPEEHRRVLHTLVERERPPVLRAAVPAELQQALHDALAAQRALLNQVEVLQVRSDPPRVALHQLREGEDAAQGVVDFVRHAAGELAHGGHLLRLDEAAGNLPLVGDVPVGAHRAPLAGERVGGHGVGAALLGDFAARAPAARHGLGQRAAGTGRVPVEEHLVAAPLLLLALLRQLLRAPAEQRVGPVGAAHRVVLGPHHRQRDSRWSRRTAPTHAWPG